MKLYDFNKAQALIEENKDDLREASLGMHEDWYWTSQTVWEDGLYAKDLFTGDMQSEFDEFVKERKNTGGVYSDKFQHIMIAGLPGSGWATPTLQLVFIDGSEKMIPCFIGKSEPSHETRMQRALVEGAMGVLSKPIQDSITPLSE